MQASNISYMAFRATPLALAIALLTGCGGGGVDTPVAEATPVAVSHVPVAGLVEAGSGIAGAAVTLKGAAMTDADASASNGAGAFVLDVSRVSGPAEVLATGGTIKGQSFAGTLRARLDRRTPGSVTPIAINIPTTLVATVMERHPSLPLADAEALVRQTLGLPEGMPLDALGSRFDLFDDEAFLQAAQAAGGFDAYIVAGAQKALNREALVVPQKMVGHKLGATTSGGSDDRVSAMALGGEASELAAGDLAGWAGKQFAGQVAGRLINVGLSVALSKAGISLPGTGDNGLAEVKQALEQMRAQLATLGVQMRDMQSDLKCTIAEYGYDGSFDGSRQKMMDDITAYTAQANMLLSLSPSDTATIAAIKAEMNTIASGYQSAHASINAFAMGNGSGGTRGALVNYSAKIKACGPIIGVKKSKALRAQYELLAAQQVMACTMVTNYYNGKDLKVLADAAAASCVTYLNELKKREINAVIDSDIVKPGGGQTFVVDSRTNRRWHYESYVTMSQIQPSPLDYGPRRGGLVDGNIYLPGKKDLDTFLGDCYNSNATQMTSCMKSKGWVLSNGNAGWFADYGSDFHVSPYLNGESRTTVQDPYLYCDYAGNTIGLPPFWSYRVNGNVVGSDGNQRRGSDCANPKGAHMLMFQNIPDGKRYYN